MAAKSGDKKSPIKMATAEKKTINAKQSTIAKTVVVDDRYTFNEFVDSIFEQCKTLSVTKKQIMSVIESFKSVIIEKLKEGKVISIPKMGKFLLATRMAREAKNPRTGNVVQIEEKFAPKFKPVKLFKDQFNLINKKK